MDKIFKLILALALIEVIATGLIAFYFVKIGLAQTIGIGVAPSLVKFNSPGTYLYEFCFFNQGDTDAEYETVNGEVLVQYQRFIVPKGTNYTSCVKKQLLLTVTQPGYFYITAKPANQTQQAGAVSIVRRVGIKVELANYQPSQTTTTTITQTTSGGGAGNIQQTTTTTIKNQTYQTTTTTKQAPITPKINESIVEKQVIESLNKSTNLTNKPSFGIIDILKIALMIGVIVGVIYLIVYIIQIV
jgi:hypothetical protein